MEEGCAWRAYGRGVGMESGWKRDGHGEQMEVSRHGKRMEEGLAWRADGRGMGMESRWRWVGMKNGWKRGGH